MNWKKLGTTILHPKRAAAIALLPLGTALLIFSMTKLEKNHPVRLVSYVLAFYTLTVWCARVPALLRSLRAAKNDCRFLRTWFGDSRLRMNVMLAGGAAWNGAYAALQLGLSVCHRSAWFASLAVYYGLLAAMRVFLARHTLRYQPGENLRRELKQYRACGWIFLAMNLALSGMMLFMIRGERAARHHRITVIAMAAYTFASLGLAVANAIRSRKSLDPAAFAVRAVSLAAASVSMLTLENTMLTTFDQGKITEDVRRLLLALSGAAVSALLAVTALSMILQGGRKLKELEE